MWIASDSLSVREGRITLDMPALLPSVRKERYLGAEDAYKKTLKYTPIKNVLTQIVNKVCPTRIGCWIDARYIPGSVSTEHVVLMEIPRALESNGGISRPSHQSTAIGEESIRLEPICDHQALESVVLCNNYSMLKILYKYTLTWTIFKSPGVAIVGKNSHDYHKTTVWLQIGKQLR